MRQDGDAQRIAALALYAVSEAGVKLGLHGCGVGVGGHGDGGGDDHAAGGDADRDQRWRDPGNGGDAALQARGVAVVVDAA